MRWLLQLTYDVVCSSVRAATVAVVFLSSRTSLCELVSPARAAVVAVLTL